MLLSSIPTDGIDMTSLSHRLGIDNSTLTRLIDVLVKNRYVQKNKHHSDKRSIVVSLTEQGEMLHSSIESEIDRFGSELFSQIPVEDQDEIKEILSSFHWIVSKYRLNN